MPQDTTPDVLQLWNTSQPTEANWPSRTAGNEQPVIRTRLQLSTANAMARESAREAVRFRRAEVRAFLTAGLDFVCRGQMAGISSDYLHDFARGLSDAVSDAVGGMRKDLDEAGSDPDAADIDVSELNALIGSLA